MSNAIFRVPNPTNEAVRSYEVGSQTRESLKAKLEAMSKERVEIPCIIGGKEIRTGKKLKVVMPHSHSEVLAEAHLAGADELKLAATAAIAAKPAWEALSLSDRSAIFLKAAELLSGPYRDVINASTMLGQSKNAYQAEIDAACELIDFFKFNVFFHEQIMSMQPISPAGMWNQLEYRPLEGFVLAITPFNFTSIAANLPSAPVVAGNTVVWKPSDTQLLSAYYTMKLFEEAGLPDGVINFVPADGPLSGDILLPMRDLAGVHFTGSTATFQGIWRKIGENIPNYKTYPRLVGETGGKGFVFAHASADTEALATAMLRGAFEYQGQKCSAASRAYVPKSIWPKVSEKLFSDLKSVSMGDVMDFSNLMNAVIDERAFKKISSYIEHAKSSPDARVLAGGNTDSKKGYFIEPTVIQALQPTYKSMVEEIFGPVLTVYVYDDAKLDETVKLCDETSPYALTGAVFARDRSAVSKICAALRSAAGNFYINDKPTGAVVGQQPFGGARLSGTNDKAGSIFNMLRWVSPRTIKETFNPPKDYRYPFMGGK